MIYAKFKIIFIHIPKNAGSTISDSVGGEYNRKDSTYTLPNGKKDYHGTYLNYKHTIILNTTTEEDERN